jgi:hypothetical protein
MPNLNGKGPFGEGPMTGRGRGRCRKKESNQSEKPDSQSNSEDKETSYGFRRRDRLHKKGEIRNSVDDSKDRGKHQRNRFRNENQ